MLKELFTVKPLYLPNITISAKSRTLHYPYISH